MVIRRPLTLAITAAIASSVVVAAVIVTRAPTPNPPPQSPAPSSRWAAVADMPAVTVADATQLLATGLLAGRAVAVAGFWEEMTPSCPMPEREPSELEGWCRMIAFADADPHMCQRIGDNALSCSGGRSGPLKPIPVTETSRPGDVVTRPAEAQRIVVIGHSTDPRLWHCAPDLRNQCAQAFVVDYMALPDQLAVEIRPPDNGVPTRMKLADAEVAADVNPGAVIAAAAVKASDVASIDPRFNLAGDQTIWLLRSIRQVADQTSSTRPMSVTIVDDATGSVVGSADVDIAPDFAPARLAIDARRPATNGSDGIAAFFRVDGSDGDAIAGGAIGGGRQFGNPGFTQHGPGIPLILPAGEYVLSVWLAQIDVRGN